MNNCNPLASLKMKAFILIFFLFYFGMAQCIHVFVRVRVGPVRNSCTRAFTTSFRHWIWGYTELQASRSRIGNSSFEDFVLSPIVEQFDCCRKDDLLQIYFIRRCRGVRNKQEIWGVSRGTDFMWWLTSLCWPITVFFCPRVLRLPRVILYRMQWRWTKSPIF